MPLKFDAVTEVRWLETCMFRWPFDRKPVAGGPQWPAKASWRFRLYSGRFRHAERLPAKSSNAERILNVRSFIKVRYSGFI